MNDKYLTHRGYVKLKADIDISKVKKELIVKERLAYGTPSYVKPKLIPIYRENANKMYLPRSYAIEKFGEPQSSKLVEPTKIDIKSNILLREYQVKTYDTIKKHILKSNTGITSLPTGFGKTILILKLIRDLGTKTLFIVPSTRLLKQTIEKIEDFLPDASVGVIQQNRTDTYGKDIIVGMLHSIARREYNTNIFDGIGLIIYDEIHMAASEDLSKCLFKINSKYILGVSATVDRDDGLTEVLKLHLGGVFHEMKAERKGLQPIVKIYRYKNPELKPILNKFGKMNRAAMLNDLSDNEKRNRFIVDLIKEVMNMDRHILVLGERRVGLEKLKEMIDSLPDFEYTTGLILGQRTDGDKLVKMKDSEINESKTANIILGTYKACGTGIDIPTLNTLIFSTPMRNIKQSEGRIFRKEHLDIQPLVIDISDQYGSFPGSEYSRRKFYKELEYDIKADKITETANGRKVVKIA